MEFALDETQQEVRDLAAEVLRRTVDPSHADDAVDAETGYDLAVWKALGDAGLLSLAVPEDLGGAGLGVLETAVVLTEVGRRAASVPALASLAFGALPVARFGTPRQRNELLQGMESGRVLTAALNEPSTPMPTEPAVTARRDGADLVLTGRKIAVMHADSAYRMLVSCTVSGQGSGLVLVDPHADGIALHRTPTSTGSPEYTVTFDAVRVPATDLLGGGCDPAALEGTHGFALAGICAVAHGAVAGALELTSEYVGTRSQFGRPLAAFQSVAGQIADVYVVDRTLELVTLAACWGLTIGNAPEDCQIAVSWLTEAVPPAMYTCHHLHGGTGVDTTYPLHRYFSLIRDLTRFVGGAQACLDRLAGTAAS